MEGTNRVAIIGDVGGHLDVFIQALARSGVNVPARHVPEGLAVIQVGDLVHKGPQSAACVSLAGDLLSSNGGRYVQLLGNHEAHYIGGPDVSDRAGVTPIDAASATTLRRWWSTGAALLATAIDTPAGPWLVTHAGLTAGLWRGLGEPSDPATAARAINSLSSDPAIAFRAGWLVTGKVDHSAGVTWAFAGPELVASWLAEGAMPFNQIHGHSSVWAWPDDTWAWGVPEAIKPMTELDTARQLVHVSIGHYTITGVDWILGVDPPDRDWSPLRLTGSLG